MNASLWNGSIARKSRSRLLTAIVSLVLPLAALAAGPEGIQDSARLQIRSLLDEKDARTPAQLKLDSQLVYAVRQALTGHASAGAPALAPALAIGADGGVLVDIRARVSDELLERIGQAGGKIVNRFVEYDAIRASIPLLSIEKLAAEPDVRFVEPASQSELSTGSVNSEGDTTHRAGAVRTAFALTGAGIDVGVLSDSVDFLAASQAAGDLPAGLTVLAGQSGVGTCGANPCTGEGTAMLEIVNDLAPGANLFFATANGGPAQMAANIVALQNAGCEVIVDDVTYFNESPFQDDTISRAVNTVSGNGVLYFSSARNSGNLDDGTSSTWEGDFADGGAVSAPVTGAGRLHDFGGGTTFDAVAVGGSRRRADLFWADPLGGSANDYDLFVLDPTGTTVRFASTNAQTGSQNPYEQITPPGPPAPNPINVGDRIVVVQRGGAAGRFLHLDLGRGRLTTATAGCVRGHNASGAANAFSVAATDVANTFVGGNATPFVGGIANPIETFSSDGPRRIFFQPNGTPITPGNFSSTGGQLLNKPDITAADDVVTSLGGFNPFSGTSAAAPHAAAIAALLLSLTPTPTPAQIRSAISSSALDIEAAGFDRDSGAGIVMAFGAYKLLNPCTISCVADANVPNEPGLCSAVVTYGAPTLVGGCGTAACLPASGSAFPVGNSTVTCTTASEDACSFHVTVRDVEPPSIVCPPDATVECTGNSGIQASDPQLVPFFAGATAADNCPGVTISNNAPPFFNLGTTPVTFSARDLAANTTPCTASVRVQDTIPPEISAALNPQVLSPANGRLRLVTATVQATDICSTTQVVLESIFSNSNAFGIANAEFGTPDFSFLLAAQQPGRPTTRSYTIIYSATDTSGNQARATAHVFAPARP